MYASMSLVSAVISSKVAVEPQHNLHRVEVSSVHPGEMELVVEAEEATGEMLSRCASQGELTRCSGSDDDEEDWEEI